MSELQMDNRKFKRTAPQGASILITDGRMIADDCMVIDVSTNGVLASVPKRIIDNKVDAKVVHKRVYSGVISNDKGDTFKVDLSPKWSANENDLRKVVGFEIVDPPNSWQSFIYGLIDPPSRLSKHKDAWGSINQRRSIR